MSQTSLSLKKSLYIFLSCLLGVFLFFSLHRIAVFFYLYSVINGSLATTFVYWRFLLFDYFTLAITLMAGAWYGIWLGGYWFSKIYEEGSHGGLTHHLVTTYWPHKQPKSLTSKISSVREHLEKDLWQLEDLAKKSEAISVSVNPSPKVRRVVRKRAPKKLNSVK